MGHIHAAAMAEYAKDATETDKPWERWEFCHMRGEYQSLHGHPEWVEDNEYRRKGRAMSTPPTPKEIAHRLRLLSQQMQDLGAAMEYTAGFDGAMAEHGKELLGGGLIANSWATAIEEEMNQ